MTNKYQMDYFRVSTEKELSGEIVPELNLWKSVIQQAFVDAFNTSTTIESVKERRIARAWFSLLNDDFLDVCYLAGIDPKLVLRQFKQLKRNMGKKFRIRKLADNVKHQSMERYRNREARKSKNNVVVLTHQAS